MSDNTNDTNDNNDTNDDAEVVIRFRLVDTYELVYVREMPELNYFSYVHDQSQATRFPVGRAKEMLDTEQWQHGQAVPA